MNSKIFPLLASLAVFAAQAKAICSNPYQAPPGPSKKEDVYKGMPFAPGEEETFEVYYMGILVGYASLYTREPVFHDGAWYRVFEGFARTGDWYKAIFQAKDTAKGHARASDFAAGWFHVTQNEAKLFWHLKQDKVLNFDQNNCVVHEATKKDDGAVKNEDNDLGPGALDVLGVIYKMRTERYEKVGQVVRHPVYSSGHTWTLVAEVVGFEEVEEPAGTYKAVKLKLDTFIGQELQQRGTVHAWIATEVPSRPLLQLVGEIKVGQIKMLLSKFTSPLPVDAPQPHAEPRTDEVGDPVQQPHKGLPASKGTGGSGSRGP